MDRKTQMLLFVAGQALAVVAKSTENKLDDTVVSALTALIPKPNAEEMKEILFDSLEALAKKTDNQIDDYVVKQFKEILNA